MTELLQKAFKRASELPPEAQDDLAEWVLEEMIAEERWTACLRDSSYLLTQLASEALEEHRQGESLPLDAEEL